MVRIDCIGISEIEQLCILHIGQDIMVVASNCLIIQYSVCRIIWQTKTLRYTDHADK